MVVAVQYSTIRDAFQVFQDAATVSTFFLVAKEMPATASSEVDVRDQATGRDAKKKIVAHPAIVLGRMFKKMLEVGFEWLGFNDEAREYIANSVEPWEELILAWAENNSCNNEAKILTDESMTIRKLQEYVVQNSKKIQAQHLELLVNAVLLLIGLREVRAALLALQAAFQLREIGDRTTEAPWNGHFSLQYNREKRGKKTASRIPTFEALAEVPSVSAKLRCFRG